jgi:hypothetical protein
MFVFAIPVDAKNSSPTEVESQNENTKHWNRAIHEAGHVVVARAVGLIPTECWIANSEDEFGDYLGEGLYTAGDTSYYGFTSVFNCMMVILAGAKAARCFGVYKVGEDMNDNKMLQDLVKKYNVSKEDQKYASVCVEDLVNKNKDKIENFARLLTKSKKMKTMVLVFAVDFSIFGFLDFFETFLRQSLKTFRNLLKKLF